MTDLDRDYYERCRRILQEVEAADAKPPGTLRVTAPRVPCAAGAKRFA